jgi:ribosome-associated protein
MRTPRQLAIASARVCHEKKATDILVLDVRKLTFMTDFFIICTSMNELQSRAIADSIQQTLKGNGLRSLGVEGYAQGRWILQDFGELVVHIMMPHLREFYQLERLWADAPRVRWERKTR